MSRRAARFTQADVVRALRAAKQAGERAAVEIAPDGTMRIVPIAEDQKPPPLDRPGRPML